MSSDSTLNSIIEPGPSPPRIASLVLPSGIAQIAAGTGLFDDKKIQWPRGSERDIGDVRRFSGEK